MLLLQLLVIVKGQGGELEECTPPSTTGLCKQAWDRNRPDCREDNEFTGCNVFDRIHCNGEDLADGKRQTNNAGECCELCNNNDECRAYTWVDSKDCYLKSGCNDKEDCDQCVSGESKACKDHCFGEGREYGRVCVCGFLEFSSRCMARCNAFCDSEIEDGTCDLNHCNQCTQPSGEGVGACQGQGEGGITPLCDDTSFCNWYDDYYPNTAYVPFGQCKNQDFSDGNYCTRPGLLRSCPSTVLPVCGYGAKDRKQLIEPGDSGDTAEIISLQLKYFFQNECYATAAGFTKASNPQPQPGQYTLGNCTGEDVYDASYVFSIFGNSPASSDIVYNGGLYAVSGIFIPTYNDSYSEDDCGCDWNDYDPVCLDTDFIDTTFWNKCFALCRWRAQQNPNSVYKSYFPPGFDNSSDTYIDAIFKPGPCEEPCKTRSPSARDCAQQGLSCDTSFGFSTCVPTNRTQCMVEVTAREEETAAAGQPSQAACVLTWNPVTSYGLWIEYGLTYAVDCLRAEGEFLFEGTCLDRCLSQCTQEEKDMTICIRDTLNENAQTDCEGDSCSRLETNFCEASCKFSSVVSNTNAYFDGPCPICEGQAIETCDNCLKFCDFRVPGAPRLCSTQEGDLYGQRFETLCEASCYGIEDPDFLVTEDSPACPAEIVENSCDVLYPDCCDLVVSRYGPKVSEYANCDGYRVGGEFHNYCNEDPVTHPEFSQLYQTVADACPFACGKCTNIAAETTSCGGMKNDCCDLAGASATVSEVGLTCADYAKPADFQYCMEDLIPQDSPFYDPERGIIYAGHACRRSCAQCDACEDNTLLRSHLTLWKGMIGIYGDCASYAPGRINQNFCSNDEVDLQKIGSSNYGPFQICKASCGACDRVSESERQKTMFEAGVSSLRPSYDVAVEDPGPTSDGAVCQSESCTPPGGAGPGECDPNIECCNHYSIGMPLDDYGLDCSSFEDVRGRDPYLFANCDQDVVTKPYLRNGKYDYFFVGQKIKYACPLSCKTCFSRCDAKNECCDYADIDQNVGPVSGAQRCSDYDQGGANDGYCQWDMIKLQFEYTGVMVGQVCARSCGCCMDEYFDEEYVNQEYDGNCEDYSNHFVADYRRPTAGDPSEKQCKGNGRKITFDVDDRTLSRHYCESKCRHITDSDETQEECYGYTWNPWDKECTIFTDPNDRPLALEPVDGNNTPLPSGAGKLVKCYRPAKLAGYCDDPVSAGPKANQGYKVRDVCRYSCGACEPDPYNPEMWKKANE